MTVSSYPGHTQWQKALLPGMVLLGTGLALALLPVTWLAIGLLGVTVTVLTLIRPHIALYLIAFAIPFGSLFEISLSGITVGVTEALIGLMVAAWIARRIAQRENWPAWPRLSLPLALFIGATMLSLHQAISLPMAAKEIIKWVEVLAVMVFAATVVPQSRSKHVVACLLLAGVAQGLLGAHQFFAQAGPEPFIVRGRFLRAYGTFEQPNPYAGYLGIVAPLALALALDLVDRWKGKALSLNMRVLSVLQAHWLNWLALGSFVVISAGIGMSWSRGAWLGFGGALVIMNLIRSRRSAMLFAGGILVVATIGALGASLLPGAVTERLTSFLPFVQVDDVRAIEITDANYASLERLAHWQSALDMWRDKPWLGVGFGNYEAAYAAYALPKWTMALGHAHNYYLNVAAETGIIGLIAYLALWGTAVLQLVRTRRQSGSPYGRALALGALGMLVHVSVHNVVDNLWVHNIYIHVAIVLGLVERTHLTGRSHSRDI
jgi:O-antigen ligase